MWSTTELRSRICHIVATLSFINSRMNSIIEQTVHFRYAFLLDFTIGSATMNSSSKPRSRYAANGLSESEVNTRRENLEIEWKKKVIVRESGPVHKKVLFKHVRW